MSDDVRLDLELAADAEIDRQVGDPQAILEAGTFKVGLQAVAYKNCQDNLVPRGVFEARCVARGFVARASNQDGITSLDDVYFVRGGNAKPP